MDNQVFRKKSLEHISSPEQLNDYLRVTNPAVWLLLTAVILLLVGVLIWSSVASIDSFAGGTAQVKDGVMQIHFDDAQIAGSVQTGMTVTVGDTQSVITSIGKGEDGSVFAVAETTLTDGIYSAKVVYRQTQVIRLLFR